MVERFRHLERDAASGRRTSRICSRHRAIEVGRGGLRELGSVRRARESRRQAKERRPDPRKAAAKQKAVSDQRDAALSQFNACLAKGSAVEALALHKQMSQTHGDWQLTQPQLLALIKALHKERLWSQSVAPMIAYLQAASDAARAGPAAFGANPVDS